MERWEIKWYLDEFCPSKYYKTKKEAVDVIARAYTQDIVIDWDTAKEMATVVYYNRVVAVIKKVEVPKDEAIRVIEEELKEKYEGLEILFKCELCGKTTSQLVSWELMDKAANERDEKLREETN